jgi:Cdc6-like AAA superfamily ATPase
MFDSIKNLQYKGYNIRTNPYPYVGVPEGDTAIFVNRKEELDIIEESLVGSLNGTSSHVVIVGNYGNGKTATLLYVKSQVEENLPNVLTAYISNPGDSVLQFYSNLLYELGLARLEQIAWSFITFVTQDTRVKEKIQKGTVLITDIIGKVKRSLLDGTNYTDFANAFLNIIFEDNKFIAWRYLTGDKLDVELRRKLDTAGNIDSDEKALRAFMTFKRILTAIGFKVINLFVDELEAIELLFTFKKQKILNGIRRLIDLNPDGLSIVMACAPEAWNGIIKEYHAFSERIFREVVLKPLSDKTIREVIVGYLNKQRTSSKKKDELYPFTEETVKEILLHTHGNMRRALMICNRAIDHGARTNYPVITPTLLKKIMPEIFMEELS